MHRHTMKKDMKCYSKKKSFDPRSVHSKLTPQGYTTTKTTSSSAVTHYLFIVEIECLQD